MYIVARGGKPGRYNLLEITMGLVIVGVKIRFMREEKPWQSS